MDEQAFKKLLNEALEPIKEDLHGVKDTQARLHTTVTSLHGNIIELQSTVTELKDTLDNRVLPSVTETELTLKSYADSYKINQLNIERVDTRLATVEDKHDIKPSEDLKVPHFASE